MGKDASGTTNRVERLVAIKMNDLRENWDSEFMNGELFYYYDPKKDIVIINKEKKMPYVGCIKVGHSRNGKATRI